MKLCESTGGAHFQYFTAFVMRINGWGALPIFYGICYANQRVGRRYETGAGAGDVSYAEGAFTCAAFVPGECTALTCAAFVPGAFAALTCAAFVPGECTALTCAAFVPGAFAACVSCKLRYNVHAVLRRACLDPRLNTALRNISTPHHHPSMHRS